MSESLFDEIDDILPPEPNGELVHWMDPRPLTVGTAGISLAAAGAFALGALAAVAVMAILRRNEPRQRIPRQFSKRAVKLGKRLPV